MGRSLSAELNSMYGDKDLIIIQDGKVVQGDPFANPPVHKIENTRLYMDEHKIVDYGPVKKSKPKHHNSSWCTPIKKKQDKRKQQRKSRKINRRK